MTVSQNWQRGGVWQYEFVRNGERFRGYCLDAEGRPVKNETQAKEAETIAKAKAIEGQGTGRRRARASAYTLAHAQAAILARVKLRRRKPEHLANIILWGDEAVVFFGSDTPFAALTQADVDRYLDAVRSATVRRWRGGKRRPTLEDAGKPELWVDTGRPRSIRQANNYIRHFLQLLAEATKVKDPVTRRPVLEQDPPLELELARAPRRKPRPMPDSELEKRLAELPPWQQETVELSRLFGLRAGECRRLERRHVDHAAKALFFRGEESKSGHDEHAFGGAAGWRLVERLERQAKARGTTFLVTWPGLVDGIHWYWPWRKGKAVPAAAWQPLTTGGNAWRQSAKRANVTDPHRFHDVRARYITEVAKTNKAAAKGAARHQHSSTTDLYIGIADDEVSRAVATAVRRRPKVRAVK